MGDLRLSAPPSIETRIRAAIQDPFSFQVIYYMRKEGASYAAEQLTQDTEVVTLLVRPLLLKSYMRRGVSCLSSSSSPPEGIEPTIFIADVIPDKDVLRWHRMAVRERRHRLIVLKSITDYDGRPGVNGLDLKTGQPIWR